MLLSPDLQIIHPLGFLRRLPTAEQELHTLQNLALQRLFTIQQFDEKSTLDLERQVLCSAMSLQHLRLTKQN